MDIAIALICVSNSMYCIRCNRSVWNAFTSPNLSRKTLSEQTYVLEKGWCNNCIIEHLSNLWMHMNLQMCPTVETLSCPQSQND